MKLNNSDTYESVKICLTRETAPIFFENKVKCIMESGVDKELAEKWAEEYMADFELEMYYEPGHGAFGVDPEAVEAGTIYSPYTKEQYEPSDDR